jgi:peptidoglycan/xylan/chitin deacetylase (PgdA/CDA1 family)
MKQRKIPILMYHQVDVTPLRGTAMRGLVVSPVSFSRQMKILNFLGYRGLSMNDLEPYLNGEKSGKVFGITFDDGYENNLRCALPILKQFGFTSTCYIVANCIGQENSWDLIRGVPQVPLMTVNELQDWVDAGQEVGSHTLTHPSLPDLDTPSQLDEILQAKHILERVVCQSQGVRNFCYPFGRFNDISLQCVKEAGYATATTTIRGRVSGVDILDLHRLPRVLVSRTTTLFHFLLKFFTNYEDKRGVSLLRKAAL